jgi:hypothetical protein
MKYWFDCEFDENGSTIELITIGIVAEDRRELYLASTEFDPQKCDSWVQEHVLPFIPSVFDTRSMLRYDIAREILKFFEGDPAPEIWSYFGDYDWVCFAQLFGKMIHLPEHLPRFCMDLKQLRIEKGNPRLPPHLGRQHVAIDDARWHRDIYYALAPLPWLLPAG